MLDLFTYSLTLDSMVRINNDLELNRRGSIEQVVTSEYPGAKYEKFCVDNVEYLKFKEGDQTIIVPHFKADNRVVTCRD